MYEGSDGGTFELGLGISGSELSVAQFASRHTDWVERIESVND
jgi:hypothetical protein